MSNGLPSLQLVGLADTEVREARERVRSAVQSSGLGFPMNQRITINLAPADLPKGSGRFDLPMALGVLAAQGALPGAALAGGIFAGELALDGSVRAVKGALAMALALAQRSVSRAAPPPVLVLPQASAAEARQVPGIVVVGVDHLTQVVEWLRSEDPWGCTPGPGQTIQAAAEPLEHRGPLAALDLADVSGQTEAKRALVVAAAGAHALLMVGPPGSGKSMLAQRLSGLLPPMSDHHALEAAAVASLSREGWQPGRWGCRPWRAPHHSCSAVALIGGGIPLRPGEVTLAHGGVLFLDELPEFGPGVLEALREPLETGWVHLARGTRQACYPAQHQLVAAMNPCPCGWLGSRKAHAPACRCTEEAVARYQGRISGPLLDRFDVRVSVDNTSTEDLLAAPSQARLDSRTAAKQVARAQARQLARQGSLNARLGPRELEAVAPLGAVARQHLARWAERWGWSGRAVHRAWRVARTLADLDDAEAIDTHHMAEALQMRCALPT
jgi:magnesium chelatase family protein